MNPTWNEKFILNGDAPDGILEVIVEDYDLNGNDFMGKIGESRARGEEYQEYQRLTANGQWPTANGHSPSLYDAVLPMEFDTNSFLQHIKLTTSTHIQ